MPGNVSLIGFDDIPEAEHFDPPLTTMRQDFHELGQDIMIAVQAVLDGSETTQTIRHLPTLVVRQSTASSPADHVVRRSELVEEHLRSFDRLRTRR